MSGPEIPPRTSSLDKFGDSPEAARLSAKVHQLKRTASALSLQSTKSTASHLSYIDVHIELAETRTMLHQNSINELHLTHSQDSMYGDEPQARRNHLRKKVKLQSEVAILKGIKADLEDKEDGELVLKRITESHKSQIMDLFRAVEGDMNKALNTGVKRKSKMQAEWKRTLIEMYACREIIVPDDKNELLEEEVGLWCPIFQCYGHIMERTAAHIMPLSTNPTNASYLLSETGGSYQEGVDLLWSPRNGLILHSILEQHFDRGTFTIVAIPTTAGHPQRFQTILLETRYEHHWIARKEGGLKWKDLHERELVFKNDFRPQRRFLYYHYITSIWRMEYFRHKSIDEIKERIPASVNWATPGKYLRGSMLRQLGEMYGDRYLGEDPEEFARGTFVGPPKFRKTEVEEVVLAAGTIRSLERRVGSGDEGGDEESSDESDDAESDDGSEDIESDDGSEDIESDDDCEDKHEASAD